MAPSPAREPRGTTAPETVPEHLRPYIATQDLSLYTAFDHATWRFILRVSQSYFARHAHQKYLDGLRETGISIDRIPRIEDMDARLRRFGWRAVPVSGFIPPAVFMEFQSLGFLPIACEMRTLEHLAYTPAPDIVHEAAGHAPILADPEYAAYLRAYGEISRKAIFSDRDLTVYEAIRELSVTKEDPASTRERVNGAQRRLDAALASVDYVSEATLMARMNWWTVEYGLVGPLDDPKIYGAGLLSSVGESQSCLRPEVPKIPFSLDCIHVSYDITRPQPQLFVTPDFQELTKVLEQFAATMAFRKGGAEGLETARKARTVTTTVLDSGVQLSGVVSEVLTGSGGRPVYVRLSGPCQLGYRDQEIPDHGPAAHREGFGTPVGGLAGSGKSPAQLSGDELTALGFGSGRRGAFRFESGIEVTGELRNILRRDDLNLVLSLAQCTARLGERVLFRPEWGLFDLACGTSVTSVFGGAADRARYLAATGGYPQAPRRPKTNLTEANRPLDELYERTRRIRESGNTATAQTAIELAQLHQELRRSFPRDWLLLLELLELDAKLGLKADWAPDARQGLQEIARSDATAAPLIARGLELIHA